MTKPFQEKFSLKARTRESARILEKYSDRIPIIVEIDSEEIKLAKSKYLFPVEFTCGQLMQKIREKTTLKPDQAIFMFCNNTIPSNSMILSQLYQEQKHEDGFLYLKITLETTFG